MARRRLDLAPLLLVIRILVDAPLLVVVALLERGVPVVTSAVGLALPRTGQESTGGRDGRVTRGTSDLSSPRRVRTSEKGDLFSPFSREAHR